MRAYVIDRYGNADGLVLRDLPAPGAPGPGQVLVRLRAASLNFRELLILAGNYGSLCKSELIPCSDGAGEVVAVGSGVTRAVVGERVMLTFHPHWISGDMPAGRDMLGRGGSVDGTLCEYACVSQEEVIRVPDHLSFEEAATLPCAALTAWAALTAGPGLQPGQSVLTQGGGGVSVFALQLAKLFGARVISLSSTAERLERLRGLGADETIDYRAQSEWHSAVQQRTAGEGVDLTVEVGGGATVERSVQATRVGGRISLVGLLSGGPALSEAFFYRGLSLHSIRVGSRDQFEHMCRAIEAHRLRPVIERVFGFDEVPRAFEVLGEGRHFGKLVIAID
ncbi:zinc-dependent alcohol dehydrogenase family protein [Pseudomonas citronellolis]|uniref:zinc-dependent alcohol dehydrogenase family protein n=1 Tax=Pseudomonas citronellolis TaxID=53408 RepID=UPI0021BFA1B2|nr:NAD(P)-dependent alcohol dehydrogenase [Pseudomonas citronellolis]UXJ50189.1 NAD(P)-dependent alcohol dehydrogenase [Pseudomonas citronellolis]